MKLYNYYAHFVDGKWKIYSLWSFTFNGEWIGLESNTRYLAKKELSTILEYK